MIRAISLRSPQSVIYLKILYEQDRKWKLVFRDYVRKYMTRR